MLPLGLTAGGYLIAKYVRSLFPMDRSRGYLDFIPFNTVFSLVMIMALHGTSTIKLLSILTVNFVIAKTWKGSWLTPILTWVFNAGALFANETFQEEVFDKIDEVGTPRSSSKREPR